MIQLSSGIYFFEFLVNDIAVIYDVDVFVYYLYMFEFWVGSLDFNLKKFKVKVLEVLEGMILDCVLGLEDVEVGDGVDEKMFYDFYIWLDFEKVGEEV